MAVVLYQRKNGFPSLWTLSMKPSACSVTSSSMVSMRFLVSGPGVLDPLPALAVRPAVQHASGSEPLLELRVLRIVRVLRLFLGIQVIEVAEELVEAVHRRQELVLVAQMVLAELAGGVAQRLQQFGDGRVFRPEADIGAGHADLGQAGADRVLAGDERGAAGGAALLAVIVGEGRAFMADAVDVGGAVAHLAAVVVADVPPADIVAPEDEDVRLACFGHFDLLCLVSSEVFAGRGARSGRLDEAQQHGGEGNEADADEEDGNREDRRLHPLLSHPGDRGEGFAPQIANRPPVLPNRNQQAPGRRTRSARAPDTAARADSGRAGAGHLLQAVEELDDREAEADQRDRRAQPRHHRALEARGACAARQNGCPP